MNTKTNIKVPITRSEYLELAKTPMNDRNIVFRRFLEKMNNPVVNDYLYAFGATAFDLREENETFFIRILT